MKITAFALAGIGSIALAGAANADFVSAELVDVSATVGSPAGFSTYRVVLNFDDPGDLIVAVGSGTINGVTVPWTLLAPGGIHNGDGTAPGHQADVKGGEAIFGQATWDTWLTLSQNPTFPNPATFSPGFIDDSFDQTNNPIQVLVEGLTSVVEDNGGWGQTPTAIDPAGHFVAQFTVPNTVGPVGGLIQNSGVITWNDSDGTTNLKSEFFVTNIPAPGALALLGLAGLAGARRRRG